MVGIRIDTHEDDGPAPRTLRRQKAGAIYENLCALIPADIRRAGIQDPALPTPELPTPAGLRAVVSYVMLRIVDYQPDSYGQESTPRQQSTVYLLAAVLRAMHDTIHSDVALGIEDGGPLLGMVADVAGGSGHAWRSIPLTEVQMLDSDEEARAIARDTIARHCPWGSGATHVSMRTLTSSSAGAVLGWLNEIDCELVLAYLLDRLLRAASDIRAI